MGSRNYSSTPETTNANRACRLLLGPCTDQLRDVLRQDIPPHTFSQVLKRKAKKLPRLTAPQIAVISPTNGNYTGNYEDMDFSLLYVLLRNITSIRPHNNGWGCDPNPGDTSTSANIERIRLARNNCVHSSSPALSNAEFTTIWSTVRSAVVHLDTFLNNGNKYEQEVDSLRYETMDPERDQIYYAELKKQAQEDQTTKTMVVNLERRVEDTAMKVEECFGRVEENAETVKEVKDQMTKLKETSVRPNEKGSMNTVENIFSSLQDIANAMGTSGSGQFDRGNGKMVSWSFKGQMMGFQWKYIGLCVDTTTGETGTAVTASRDGAIKHSTKDLFQKLTAKNLL